MKVLVLLSMLALAGCSAFSEPYSSEPPPVQINRSVVLTIKIDKDLSKYGIKGKAASSCTPTGICVLYLPKLKHPMDSRGWCTYGVMLGRAIFGDVDNGMECAAY